MQVLSPYPNYLAIYLSMYPHLPLVIYLSIHLSIHSSVYLSMSIYLCLSIYVYLSMSIYLCLSIYLPPITPHYLHVAPPARTSSRRVATCASAPRTQHLPPKEEEAGRCTRAAVVFLVPPAMA